MTIERASAGDLAMRARAAHSPVPERMGAVLVLDAPAPDPEELRRVVAARLGAVPRLHERMVRLPPGAGRPIWAEDPGLDPDAAVRVRRCPAPGDEAALLGLVADLAGAPFEPAGSLWTATVVTGLAAGRSALVLLVDHTVADGLGGLAVLGRLVDPGPGPRPPATARPGYRALVADAARSRLAALGRTPAAVRALRRARGALSGPPAEPCSLLAPTGPRRAFAVARADLAAVHAAAAAAGATVNDALLSAVAGALRDLLAARREAVGEFRVGVAVAVHRTAGVGEFANAVAPLAVGVPSAGTAEERLRRTAGVVARHRAEMADPEAGAVLAPVLRAAASLGLYRRWLRRQRMLHTLVSDVPGPRSAVSLAGAPVATLIPLSVGDGGNVTVSFVALSYAGTLTVTAVADPERVPDLPVLARALQAALDELCAAAPRAPGSAVPRP
ncbi:wax ester/triacylglycerol synthase domain-containing protein [Geodermatophilus sp. URMC 64]